LVRLLTEKRSESSSHSCHSLKAFASDVCRSISLFR
jgi:hypothetical protein